MPNVQRSRLLAWSMAMFVGACSRTSSTPTEAADAAVDGSSDRSFDPRGYTKACATKGDCTLVPIITGCRSCCSTDTAVNAAAVRDDLDAVTRACGGGGRRCLMACEPAHAECVEEQCVSCTERDCESGVLVHVAVTLGKQYVFEGTIDGVTLTCTVDVLEASSTIRSDAGVELVHESTDGQTRRFRLRFHTTTAKMVTFRVTQDGNVVGEKTFEPSFATEPGPNGPHCAPKECVLAQTTFP